MSDDGRERGKYVSDDGSDCEFCGRMAWFKIEGHNVCMSSWCRYDAFAYDERKRLYDYKDDEDE